MRERGIDERGFWCVPLDGTSWIHLPKLLNSALQRDGSFVPMTQLCTHCTHLGTLDFLHNALAYKQLEMFGMTTRAVARGRSRQTLDKLSVCDSHNLFCNSHLCYKFPALSPHTARVTFLCLDTLDRVWAFNLVLYCWDDIVIFVVRKPTAAITHLILSDKGCVRLHAIYPRICAWMGAMLCGILAVMLWAALKCTTISHLSQAAAAFIYWLIYS